VPVYGIVKPILQLVENILPSHWRKGIGEFLAVMDKVCPPGKGLTPKGTPLTFEAVNQSVLEGLANHTEGTFRSVTCGGGSANECTGFMSGLQNRQTHPSIRKRISADRLAGGNHRLYQCIRPNLPLI
jgi:hypothetical protein